MKNKNLFALGIVVGALALCANFVSQAEARPQRPVSGKTINDMLGKRLAAVIPDPGKLMDSNEVVDSYLKGLGYTGSYSTFSENGKEGSNATYTIKAGAKKCVVNIEKEDKYSNSYLISSCKTFKVTITGDAAALNDYYQKALQYNDGMYSASKDGNTVTIEEYFMPNY